jgi:hypothetical protein
LRGWVLTSSAVLVFCAELASALHLERLVPTISSDQSNRTLEVVPILVLVVALLVRTEVSPSESVGLLTVGGVIATILFSAFIQLSQRVKSLIIPGERSRADANNREFLGEVGSNARYASHGQLFFAVSAGVHGVNGLVASSVGLAMAAYLAMLFLMVLKRVNAVLGHELRQ